MSKPVPELVSMDQMLVLAPAVVKANRFSNLASIDGEWVRVSPVSPIGTDRFMV